MSRLTRDGTAEPVSRDQILRGVRGQGNIHFPCSADHVQDWQPYPRLIHALLYVTTIHTTLIHTTYSAHSARAVGLIRRHSSCWRSAVSVVGRQSLKSEEQRNIKSSQEGNEGMLTVGIMATTPADYFRHHAA